MSRQIETRMPPTMFRDTMSMSKFLPGVSGRDHEVAVAIDRQGLVWIEHRHRGILLDQRRTLDGMACPQSLAGMDRRIDPAFAEPDRAAGDRLGRTGCLGEERKLELAGARRTGDKEIDDSNGIGEAEAEPCLMLVVEGLEHGRDLLIAEGFSLDRDL